MDLETVDSLWSLRWLPSLSGTEGMLADANSTHIHFLLHNTYWPLSIHIKGDYVPLQCNLIASHGSRQH